jgi:glycosyltransferase involved in cell wall biosynthesis
MNTDFVLKLIQDTKHDTIYLNSMYSKFFTIYPLKWKIQKKINSKIVLAPRGMLGDGALAIKGLKKQLFLAYCKLFGLFKGILWQSTSLQETLEIKKRIAKDAHIIEVSNLPNTATELFPIVKNNVVLKLCFISRISEKKNLNYALDILKCIENIEICFDVYGPIEDDEYWTSCLKNAALLPKNINYNYKGVLKPHKITPTLTQYHALLLPTQNENYGHIIVESLQHGRPVIISDQTPWRNLKTENVGFDISLNEKQKFIEAITTLAQLNQSEYDTMCKSCISYINHQLNLDEIKSQYLELFN